jgi:NTP pyrophosphatase (non-canonical NTP hydrolase)
MFGVVIFLAFVVILIGFIFGVKSNKNREQLVYLPEVDPDYEALNNLMFMIYRHNLEKGWRTPDDHPIVGDYIANIHSEVSELWEAHRRHKLDAPCDKSETMHEQFGEILSSKEEEIADIIIRALDTAHAVGITNVGRAVRLKHLYNKTRAYRHGNLAA